ncbi:hypothetical protein [Alloacidobacterium sp.]|uniref:hypothetical protein n=1 Tax=Alloacidobacterium sp. TaxID=2951999 RepID=UPI002D76604F|nr:hypothetical protein [Alloacidobacterium sp.]
MRGDGYYDWDAGLNKLIAIVERARLQLHWKMFNVTNSVRFDSHSINATLDNAPNLSRRVFCSPTNDWRNLRPDSSSS